MIKIVHQSDQETWRAARQRYVTASAACALFDGVAPSYYNVRTLGDLVRLKAGLMDEADLGPGGSIRSRLEAFLASEFARDEGLDVEPFGWLIQDEQCERLAATPDAIVHYQGMKVAADFKVVRSMAPEHCKPTTRSGAPSQQAFLHGLPLYHNLQLQAQMACLGDDVRKGALLVLHLAPDLETKTYWVDRHDLVIQHMRHRAREVFRQVEALKEGRVA